MQFRVFKRSISAAIILTMLVVLLLPVSVPAATNYQIKTMRAGRWVTAGYYKITISKPGRINFSFAKGEGLYDYGSADIYTNLSDMVNSTNKGSHLQAGDLYYPSHYVIAVDKGTYYLSVGGKVKFTFTAAATPQNYCPSKAKALRANTKAYAVFTPSTSFARWYKVTLPKKKKITFWSDASDALYRVQIFNKKLKVLHTVSCDEDDKYRTVDALPKGTYYFRVDGSSFYGDEYAFGEVIELKWK